MVNQVEKVIKVYETYGKNDFQEMERELEKYAEDKMLPIIGNKQGERELVHFISTEGERLWYQDNGALAISYKEEWIVKDPIKFDTLQNKMFQYNQWKRKKEYAIKMQTKDLLKMAEEIGSDVHIDILKDDIPF